MEQDEGFGCRPTVTALGLLAAFVVIAATAGVSLALGDGCEGICETAGFTLYAAALPAPVTCRSPGPSMPRSGSSPRY